MINLHHTGEKKILLMSTLSYTCIFFLKVGAYMATGFMALLAETLHTLTDMVLSGFLLVALIFSERRANETHMFGYGRAQNVAALAAATFFLSTVCLTLYEQAFPKLLNPNSSLTYQQGEIGAIVVLISMIFVSVPLVQMILRKNSGAVIKVQLLELINDELALITALFSIIFTILGYPLADPFATIIIASIITLNAIRLFKENMCVLLGKSPGKEYLDKLVQLIENIDGVLNVTNVKAEYIGPEQILTTLTIFIAHGTSIEIVEKIVNSVEKKVHTEFQYLQCTINIGVQ